MTDRIHEIIEGLIDREGGFVDHPHDRGGATRFGITERRARAEPYGYEGEMSDLPRELAHRIYRDDYVDAVGFDKVLRISEPVGVELIDTGVLMGPGTAVGFLQRALNVFNRDERDFSDIEVDGIAGSRTREALKRYLHTRAALGELVLVHVLNGLQQEALIEIAENDPRQETFVFGQIAKRALPRAYID